MPTRTVRIATLAALIALPLGHNAARADAPLFMDTFHGAKVEDSDKTPNFWTAESDKGTASKSKGTLTLTATGDAYASEAIVSDVRPDFNFFAAPLTFSVSGIAFSGTGATPDQQVFRLAVVPERALPYSAATALELRLSADGLIVLGYKVGQTDPAKKTDAEWANRLLLGKVPGTIRGLDLTLTATGYALTVRGDGGKALGLPLTGKYADQGPGLKASDWGAGGSALLLQGQKAGGKDDNSVTVVITSVTVSKAATPAP